jgi:hypothetical protein
MSFYDGGNALIAMSKPERSIFDLLQDSMASLWKMDLLANAIRSIDAILLQA